MRPVAILLGATFGFALAWSGMPQPDRIRDMLLLEDAYFFLVMFSSMAVAFAGLRLLRRRRFRALLTGEPVSWESGRPAPRHVGGSMLFGVGWAVSLSCPGPIAAQLGQGLLWSLCTIGGIAAGVLVYARLQRGQQASAGVRAA
ncbi:MAG TPA: DUF6691 family protein [Gaiellaceae bacterium]|nr:DUF6691 family protein [Gaiellaceae bacterium]